MRFILSLGILIGCLGARAAPSAVVWQQTAQAGLIVPRISGPMANIVDETINGYTADKFGWKLLVSHLLGSKSFSIVAGNADNNAAIAQLGREGVNVATEGLADEEFRILTCEKNSRRYVLLLARTPVALKYASQELVFFHMPASVDSASIDWPLDIRRVPQFAYRGIYMLPCWAQHDSVAHWRRVLEFTSELTCNRNYFWLDGFPLLPQYGGEYTGTELAQPDNVRSLIAQCKREGMKFMIGGGWDTWHQRKLFGDDVTRSVGYYLALFHLLPGSEGIYLEPVGEGSKRTDPSESLKSVAAIRQLAETIWRERPDFEFAIAAGKFNPKPYLDALDAIDRKRMYWTWGWGDPTRDHALAEHPLILRWHTVVKMSDWHGSTEAPRPDETALPGFYTSYDPGMGFGNTWNGRGYGVGTGIPGPREFDPHTIPYFAHEYWFRERVWDVHATREQFAARLARRLFDSDMPPEAITNYLTLQEMCHTPAKAIEEFLAPIEKFTNRFAHSGTPRNQDTIRRMQEAIAGFRKVRPA
jgi:hypothetical protein